MANTKIDIVGAAEIPTIANLYSSIFRPPHPPEFFERRFRGRYNVLLMIASIEQTPVGFFTGFELKPAVYFAWLYGVLPTHRRLGIASQLVDAVHSWAGEHDYDTIRFECHNQHRPMLHLAISLAYDIVGIRWDHDRADNLVIFEKSLQVEK